VRYAYDKKDGPLPVELTPQSCSLRANPMTGGFTRAAWKTPGIGTRGSGETGANYAGKRRSGAFCAERCVAGIFSSLLTSSAVHKARRKQSDIIAFED